MIRVFKGRYKVLYGWKKGFRVEGLSFKGLYRDVNLFHSWGHIGFGGLGSCGFRALGFWGFRVEEVP